MMSTDKHCKLIEQKMTALGWSWFDWRLKGHRFWIDKYFRMWGEIWFFLSKWGEMGIGR